MVDLNYILLLVFSGFFAGIIGLGLAALAQKFKDKMMIRKAKKFLEGKTSNTTDLEGEKFDIRKFTWKDKEGHTQKLHITPFSDKKPLTAQEPPPQMPPKEPEKQYKRLSDYQ